jgi:hypothetical protein
MGSRPANFQLSEGYTRGLSWIPFSFSHLLMTYQQLYHHKIVSLLMTIQYRPIRHFSDCEWCGSKKDKSFNTFAKSKSSDTKSGISGTFSFLHWYYFSMWIPTLIIRSFKSRNWLRHKILNREGDRLNYHTLPCDRLNWHTLLNQWEDSKFTWSIIMLFDVCTSMTSW